MKSTTNSATNNDLGNIEAEYIKNLQQQIYFLELESNYLYPFFYLFSPKSEIELFQIKR